MQWVGRLCDACDKRVSSELNALACPKCEVVFHDRCVSDDCPLCLGALATRDDLAERRAVVDEGDRGPTIDDDDEALAAECARGRSVLWSCVFTYLGLSLILSVSLLWLNGDFVRFGAAVVRWLLTLEGVRRIARGSVFVAKLAIGLAVVGGLSGVAMAAMDSTLSILGLSAIFGITMLVIATRLATSSAFWTYVRAQKRLHAAGDAKRKQPTSGQRR